MAERITRRRQLADIPPHGDNPLDAAVAARDRNVLKMVEHAIRHRNCLLAFQPVMQARPPHATAFHEGLIRVLDETGRVIPARDFMAAAENSELGRELDCIALDIGLRMLARHPDLRLSINMSARSIGYRRWMRVLDRHLGRDTSLGRRLILEISESSTMTVPELVLDFMTRLQDRDIAFALDDFGSGQIGLRHFRDFFFDAVKIDGEFVRGIHANPDNQALARALIAIAREFDMLTIAESVETEKDARFLAANGIDCMQGYLFGAPTVRPGWATGESARRRAAG